jgi:hypothetical protein
MASATDHNRRIAAITGAGSFLGVTPGRAAKGYCVSGTAGWSEEIADLQAAPREAVKLSLRDSGPTPEKIIPYALLGMTAVTGLVDAVCFLSLGRVFTANMTGNIVMLAFATTHVPGLSIARSLTALFSFLVGAIFGGRIMARAGADAQIRFAA